MAGWQPKTHFRNLLISKHLGMSVKVVWHSSMCLMHLYYEKIKHPKTTVHIDLQPPTEM